MLLLLVQISAVMALGQDSVTIRENVDATDAAHNVLHTTLTIPVRPGRLRCFIRSDPVSTVRQDRFNDMAGLETERKWKVDPWKRDEVEMFAFHCDVPAGVSQLEVTFAMFLSPRPR